MRQQSPAGICPSSLGMPEVGLTFATQGSIPHIGTQPRVAHRCKETATVRSVDPKDYWRLVCAPKLREQKESRWGREMPAWDIADAVSKASGKPIDRAAVGHWLTGIREPYFSQFIALCTKLEIDPVEVMTPATAQKRRSFRVSEGKATQELSDRKAKKRTAR